MLTTYTDIKKGKIKNAHLVTILSMAIILYCVSIAAGTFKLSLAAAINLTVGLILGFILYAFGTWKAGDAKLFLLYSLLLMHNKNAYILFLPCLTLFANIFLTSFFAVLPSSLKDLFDHKNEFFKYVISKKNLISFIKIWLILFSFSFFIGPLILNYASHNNIVFYGFILFSYLVYQIATKIKYLMLLLPVLLIGATVKLLIIPGSISLRQVIDFIKYATVYLIITSILAYIISSEKNKYTYMPLAPFMLLGAALSTTKFLEFAMKILLQLR